MTVAIKSGQMSRITIGKGASTPGTYSFGEMLQLLDFLEGKREIPADLRPICGYHPNYMPGPGAPGMTGADVCLMQPNGLVDIDFDGVKLNRAQVLRYVTTPLKPLGRDVAKLANSWYIKGVLGCNEALRSEASAALLLLVPEDIEGRDLIVSVLERARGVERDTMADVGEIVRRVPIPIGMISYAYQHMPDGRPVFWPADFQQHIKAAAERYDLPFLEPWRLILERGGQPVLKEDLRHYREEFIPEIATLYSNFASDVRSRGALAA
jgi:hypothetical protein